ncbi:PTS transporter subunit EIIC [Mollicutes bacterium LVI A0039]|nr:PTS transporter subunit EIIC [Mollicutes bacterium LVI A0039]
MSKEQTVAKKILELVGGSENVRAVEHCATRLRLSLKDSSIAEANGDLIDEIDGVSGHFESVGQFQIILGTGFVNAVYSEFLKLDVEKGNIKDEIYSDLNVLQKLSRILGDIFIPIIPAIVASGMFMGLANTLKYMEILSPDSQLALVIGILTDTAFIFLPALICWSATKKFGGNPVLGIVLGLMLVSPSLPNAWAAAGGFGDVEPLKFSFGFLSVNVIGMQGQVLTPLFLGYLISLLEKHVRKITPQAIDIIVVPAVSLILSLMLGLFVFGPVLYAVEHAVTNFVFELMYLPLGIGQAIFGFLNPVIVMTGLHHAFGPLEIVMIAEHGSTPLNAAASSANIAMAGAALGCALRLKNTKAKSLGLSSAITAGFGITEPALFGVILRTPRVLLLGMLGGAAGGLASGIFQLGANGTGVTGIPGVLLYLGTGQALSYIIAMAIAFGTALVLTYKFGGFESE